MKFQLVFLLSLIGSSQAQGIPGVICGITGLLCPPTTVAPTTTTTTVPTTTTTADDTNELCFTVPGGNINIVIDPTQLTQDEIDQVKQLLENSLSNVFGSLDGTINGALNGLVGGLTGILNPGNTPAPTGDGQICVVIRASDLDQLTEFLEDVFSRLTAFFNCLKTLETTAEQFQNEATRVLNEIDALRSRFTDCTDYEDFLTCYRKVVDDARELVTSLPDRFSTYTNTVRDGIDQCITEATSA